jgi:peptidyl-prolyl cis-trans isomerase SDCCAG10
MSSLYNLEPQPTAKVILNTTAGEIELELFAKQTPITSRNFLQLCLDGYYDSTVFHRLVPGFIIQGGDPTGTGSGGESSYEHGKPFQDEFHTRLRFNRRGLLGMANSGKNDNASQFFLTLGDSPELQEKNTMFGRVVGDTLYNLMKMGEGELAGPDSDRPLYPYKIKNTEVLVNPFEDMVKRDLKKRALTTPAEKDKKKPKRKAGKAILSFGGDEEEEDGMTPIIKKPKFNPKLVSGGQDVPTKPAAPPAPKIVEAKKEKPVPRARKSLSPSPPPKREQILSSLTRAPPKRAASPSDSASEPESDDDGPEQDKKVSDLVSKTNAQIEELKASMRRTGPTSAPAAKKKSVLEAMIPETSTKGRKRGKEDSNAMKLFQAFKNKLDTVPAEERNVDAELDPTPGRPHTNGNGTAAADDDEDEVAICDLHFVANCQSCSKWDEEDNKEEDEDLGGTAWMSHKLSFAKDRLGKDLEWKRKNEEELVVIDPREREKDLGVGKKGRRDDRDQGKQRQRDRPSDRGRRK